MPPLVVPNTVQVRLDWTLTGGYQGKNVLHYLVPGGQPAITVADADSVFGSLVAGFLSSGFNGIVADSNSVDSVTLRDLRSAGIAEIQSTGSPSPGVGVGDALPRETAIVVTLRSAFASRSGRGRTYLGGLIKGAAGGQTGRITQIAMDAATDFLLSLLALTVNGQPWNLGVMSRTDLLTRAVVQAITRDDRFDRQNSRDSTG